MVFNVYDRVLFFQELDPEQRTLVQPLFVPCDLYAGTIIFEQGENAEYLYLVTDGEVIVRFKPDDGPALTVAHVRPLGMVGWSAALGSSTYTSSAVCFSECHLLRVRSADLRELCNKHPETGTIILEHLATLIAQRLRNTHTHVLELLKQGMQLKISVPLHGVG
jgi:CRP/FNR family transcriptional regulator, cyclic AMP receptor protein